MKIPKQLCRKEFRFCLLKAKTKIPFETAWQNTNNYSYDDVKARKHNGNLGIVAGFGKLRILDCDKKEFANQMFEALPETFTVRTGSGGTHFYLISEYNTNHVLKGEVGEYRASRYQAVIPGSVHPNNKRYEIAVDADIAAVDAGTIKSVLKPYLRPDPNNKSYKEDLQKPIVDNSRSGKEFKEIIKLISKGLSKEEVFKEMQAFAKWSKAPQQYREMSYTKAKAYVEANKPVKEEKGDPNLECLEVLQDKNIFSNIAEEFDKTVVGEHDTKQAIFLPLCSIFVENIDVLPHIFVTGESSAGKSWIAKKIFDFFPEDQKVWRTKLTNEVFTYWHNSKFEPTWTWDGKILYVEDPKNNFLNSDTFRNFLSEGAKSTVIINQMAIDIEIKGRPTVILTTAHTNPRIEIINRLCMIAVDESEEQTHLVLKFEAEESKKPRANYNPLFRKALEYLKRVSVQIPYAAQIVDCFPIKNIRVRRDFKRFLALIKCSAALHQYQRKQEGDVFIAEEQDYELARKVFAKMQSNDMMIALNHKQKKAYDVCKDLTERKEWFAVKDAHAENPALASLKHWYKLIDDLARDGLLEAKVDEEVAHSKAPTVYRAVKYGSFVLPKYNELIGKIG